MKTSKLLSLLIVVAMLSTSFLCISASGYETASHSGYIQMKKLSKAEIVQLVQDNNISDFTDFYKITPSVTSPYSLGSVRADVLQAGLDRLNTYRRLAGINPVESKNEYTNYAQAASVTNAANDIMTHYPTKPAGMPDALYNAGAYAACRSNIACYYGYTPPTGPVSFSVDMWMNDSDAHNIATLGHRRWAINPTMAYTGFGCATSADGTIHTSMYAFDTTAARPDYDFVSWPPSGYMANDTEFFTAEHAWNITLNRLKYNTADLSDVKVTLKNSAGKTWIFEGKNTDSGFFRTDSNGYGSDANAIIFRPDGIEGYKGVYTVKIEGLKAKDNSPAKVIFKVDFFSSKNYIPSPSESTTHPTTTSVTVTEKQTQSTTKVPEKKPTTTAVPENKPTPTTKKPVKNTTTTTVINTTATTTETTTVPVVKLLTGDATNDNKVNAADARLALRFAAKLETPTTNQSLAADVTKDGKITASDARTILRVSARLESFENAEFFVENQTSKKIETKTHHEEKALVYVTPTGKKYHRASCRTIGEATTALRCNDAKEKGYDACKICKP